MKKSNYDSGDLAAAAGCFRRGRWRGGLGRGVGSVVGRERESGGGGCSEWRFGRGSVYGGAEERG